MLNKEEIQKIIPHRDPFLLIDQVEAYVPGEWITASKLITQEEYYFKGHFPGNPVMPGVILIETLAQAGAVCILSVEENRGKTAYFAAIKKARFKKKVVPGTCLRLEVVLTKKMGSIGVGEAEAYDETGDLVASCELTFAIE